MRVVKLYLPECANPVVLKPYATLLGRSRASNRRRLAQQERRERAQNGIPPGHEENLARMVEQVESDLEAADLEESLQDRKAHGRFERCLKGTVVSFWIWNGHWYWRLKRWQVKDRKMGPFKNKSRAIRNVTAYLLGKDRGRQGRRKQ